MLDKAKMKCNSPRKSPNPKKKRVVKACSGGTEKIIHYGASGYGHNYSAAARKSFKARHWACKDLWGGKFSNLNFYSKMPVNTFYWQK